MQTCGTQLRWQFSSIQLNAFWSIDNITIGSNGNSVPITRRELLEEAEHTHLAQKRQSIETCNSYYDHFDFGNYDTSLWSSVNGGSATLYPCGVALYWLYFTGSGTRLAMTRPLNLQGLGVVTFNLLFGSDRNSCDGIRAPSSSQGVTVQYRIGSDGVWITLEDYNSGMCCTRYPYELQTIQLPVAAQVDNVYLRGYQPVHTTATYHDVWAIDNIRIGEITDTLLYQDTFSSSTVNTNLWLSVAGSEIINPPCSGGNALYFDSDYTRQALTQHLDFRRAESIGFVLRIGSTNGRCEMAEIGENVELSWRVGNGAWSTLEVFDSSSYQDYKYVFVGLHDNLRVNNVQLRISQVVLATSDYDTWSILNFEVHAYNQTSTGLPCSIPPDPTPIPTTPSPPTVCNYYFDDFNTGEYKTSLWSTVTGVRIARGECSLRPVRRYSFHFFENTQTREVITHLLDLRGVKFIRFYLIAGDGTSGNGINGCSPPSSAQGIYVDYRIGNNGTFNNLEYYHPSCCPRGKIFTVYLPKAVQVNSVQFRWSQPEFTSFVGSSEWVLDDVQIGENVDTILYEDSFTTGINPALWSSIVGGVATRPPCGLIHVGDCLYFSREGTREAVTHLLDLRQADGVGFFLMTVTEGSRCEGLDPGEFIELSIRTENGSWTRLDIFSDADGDYSFVAIPDEFRVSSAQLRWRQPLIGVSGQDVWSIDTIKIHNTNPKTSCSMACISDDFDFGNYSTSVWSSVSGAQVISPPCSIKTSSMALYFNESGTREAITQALDLRGLYAISFTLQIVTYSGGCAEITTGNVVNVYYSTTSNSDGWIEIGTFSGRGNSTETAATISLPREARNQSVYIRIAQSSYTDSVWSLDDFSIYSPDQCPPLLVTGNTTVAPPTPTPIPLTNSTCNFYLDNFDNGLFNNELWLRTSNVRVLLRPCGLSSTQRFAVQFWEISSARELVTRSLDLRGIRSLSFYLLAGSSDNSCSAPVPDQGISVDYRVGNSSTWVTIEYFEPSCCSNGRTIALNFPPEAQVSSVYLRWYQPDFTSFTGSDVWVVDDVLIGNYVETTLYGDEFSTSYDTSVWSSVSGARVTTPPCGVTYTGDALYFSQAGTREAITQTFDLRDATAIRFYIRLGDSTNRCDPPDTGEDVELSYRINNNGWTLQQTFVATGFRDALLVYIKLDQMLLVSGVQFRFRQTIVATDSQDVWSIDSFAIVSRRVEARCSVACYSDDFNIGYYNSELWSTVTGETVSIPPCVNANYGTSLYFTGSGARQAITYPLDLRGLYAISFILQIGSFDNTCDQAETGDDVVLYYSVGGSDWIQLESFRATSYIVAETLTVPIPRAVRMLGVSLRWAQTQHSGSFQDVWFIDNVGIYSPDECPPLAYRNVISTTSTQPSTTTNLVFTSTSSSTPTIVTTTTSQIQPPTSTSIMPSLSSSRTQSFTVIASTNVIVSTSVVEPLPTSTPLPDDCFEIFDPLNNGVYK